MAESCESCRFFDFGGAVGYCRRFPPTLTGWKKHEGQRVGHPAVEPIDWCGEYLRNPVLDVEHEDEGPDQGADPMEWKMPDPARWDMAGIVYPEGRPKADEPQTGTFTIPGELLNIKLHTEKPGTYTAWSLWSKPEGGEKLAEGSVASDPAWPDWMSYLLPEAGEALLKLGEQPDPRRPWPLSSTSPPRRWNAWRIGVHSDCPEATRPQKNRAAPR